ncbi:MAG: dihydroorotate dehydrogenase electron transfer subunit [Lachnospiraceae bacterium]|nr:dihydroorotate dehydrogenase electron transfer subunit [Lachnospiraceae bacterium]
MKKKTAAKVLSQKMIATKIYDLWLETDIAKDAHAGQFIGVYTNDKSAILPRPISICEVSDDRNSLRLVYRVAGKGTGNISELKAGDCVEVIGVLGNGYELDSIFSNENGCKQNDIIEKTNVILMGGGIGIPPMLQLAKEVCAQGINPTIIVGYRDSEMYLNQDLAKYGTVEIATEDGSVGTKGNVLNVVDNKNLKPDFIMACGPMPMLRAIKNYAANETENGRTVKAYISLEERMACGVGACLGCVCKTKEIDHHSHVNNARICTDGPVFDAEDVEI